LAARQAYDLVTPAERSVSAGTASQDHARTATAATGAHFGQILDYRHHSAIFP
jgi:hypothetical protein